MFTSALLINISYILIFIITFLFASLIISGFISVISLFSVLFYLPRFRLVCKNSNYLTNHYSILFSYIKYTNAEQVCTQFCAYLYLCQCKCNHMYAIITCIFHLFTRNVNTLDIHYTTKLLTLCSTHSNVPFITVLHAPYLN